MHPGATDPRTTAQGVLRAPEWLCHRYDATQDAFQFRRVPRAKRNAAFLTDEYLGPADEIVAVPRTVTQADAAAAAPGRVHFIFHSAFCASTMLCHALDVAGSASALSEPVVINDLVGWRQRGADPRTHGRVMGEALRLLARPFAPGEAVIVKPSNIVNPIAAGLLTLRPDAQALLLHAPLRTFLISVAHKGLWCRLWVRELLERLLADQAVRLGFEPRDYFRQSDLQVAAVGWLAQHALFHALAQRFGAGRIATLDSDRLTDAPEHGVAAVARHFGLSTGAAPHPALTRDSKTGAAFATGQRARDHAATYAAHRAEIDMVCDWAGVIAKQQGIALDLPLPIAL